MAPPAIVVATVCDVVLLEVVDVEFEVAFDEDEDMWLSGGGGWGPPMPFKLAYNLGW